MTSGTRLPTWKERENNKRRERRRRAIAAKIFAGLRVYGNYKLPKHCDNNEVLKALCNEAGWIVEEDGTTYRKGCKPITRVEVTCGSASASLNPSSISSLYTTNGNPDPNSLIPWLKNLSSGSNPSSNFAHHIYIPGGSISAPVTPPLASPTCQTPRMTLQHYPLFLPSSTPQSPGHQTPTGSGWLSGVQTPQDRPSSPTFSLVASNPFGFKEGISGNGSRMWTPGQSGTCSPAVFDQTADVPMSDAVSSEFAFGSHMKGLVKPWEGERIHEECISDDLELTLGNPSTR
ncbi:BES1/BZR1 homolog protein 4-like isoform X2 [Bidens hawaiensis]|uniref:BES1/BZR1 homolog protein 4-like isoform X1 n=1 Tax=Bidens hawaiensis TaxID=980011 RepID=UPI00404A1951